MSHVIAKGEPDKAAAIAMLLQLGLWDHMSVAERQAFCEHGEVWNTPCGRRIVELIEAVA